MVLAIETFSTVLVCNEIDSLKSNELAKKFDWVHPMIPTLVHKKLATLQEAVEIDLD